MPDALPPVRPVEDPPPISILGGILSYLIPGLGQIAQGRIGKGLLFMVTLLGMFHLGQAMGHWQNVYMPPVEPREGNPIRKPLISVYNRWHFAGQFWIGIAAWPAIYQFYSPPTEADLIDLPVDEGGNVIPEAHVSVMGGMPVAVDDQNQPIKGARVIKGLSFWREFQLAPVGEAENLPVVRRPWAGRQAEPRPQQPRVHRSARLVGGPRLRV